MGVVSEALKELLTLLNIFEQVGLHLQGVFIGIRHHVQTILLEGERKLDGEVARSWLDASEPAVGTACLLIWAIVLMFLVKQEGYGEKQRAKKMTREE